MSGSSRLGARLVWGAWGLLSASLLLLVARLARNVPYWDDWKLVSVLLGGQPPSLAWTWDPCNEHRLPLSKALLVGLATVSGGDLRWAMFASALLLCALAALLIVALARLAGPLRWTDLVLPLALLNAGHQFNLLFQMQLHFLLAVLLFVATLTTLLRVVEPDPPRGSTWLLFAVALPLPWTSGLGVCLAPALVLWMGWASTRVAGAAPRRALRVCAAALMVCIVLLVLARPETPVSHPGFQGVAPTAATMLRCLATALGPVGRELWPWSGFGIALLGLSSGLLLLRVMRQQPERRLPASLLLAGLLAVAGLALVIGESRAGLGWEAGFATRYTTAMAPGLCCAYLAWRAFATGRGRRLVPAALCVALGLALPVNTGLGLRDARAHAADLEAFAADVRAGLPVADLVAAHAGRLCPSEVRLTSDLTRLRQRRLWLYRRDE